MYRPINETKQDFRRSDESVQKVQIVQEESEYSLIGWIFEMLFSWVIFTVICYYGGLWVLDIIGFTDIPYTWSWAAFYGVIATLSFHQKQ